MSIMNTARRKSISPVRTFSYHEPVRPRSVLDQRSPPSARLSSPQLQPTPKQFLHHTETFDYERAEPRNDELRSSSRMSSIFHGKTNSYVDEHNRGVSRSTSKNVLMDERSFMLPKQPIPTRNSSLQTQNHQKSDEFLEQGDFEGQQQLISNDEDEYSVVERFMVQLWRNQDMCDLILKIGRYELLAHKIVLAAHSVQFADQCIKEVPTGACEVDLTDTTVDATQEILKYMYTKDFTVTVNNVEPIISCGRQLGVTDILGTCKSYLMSFNKNNALTFMWTAEKYELAEVYDVLYDFVCRNFGVISRTETFLSAPVDKIHRLLQDDNLNVDGELDIYFIATNWLDYNRQERIKHTTDILKAVRFALIVPDDIVQYVEPNIQHYSEECSEMLTNVFRYHALRYSGGGLDENLPRNRKYISLEERNSQPRDFTQNNSQLTQSETSSVVSNGLTTKRYQPPVENTFLTFGGIDPFCCDDNRACRMVEEYNSTTNEWRLLTKLPDTRHHHGIASLDGYFYLVGGLLGALDDRASQGPTSSCYRYSYKENYWSRIGDMTTARTYHGVAVLEGVLYAIGGQNDQGNDTDSVEFYNPDTDIWGNVSPLSECKRGVATIGHNGLVYCVGGYNDLNGQKSVLATVECFDPLKNEWTHRNPISVARCHANLVEIKGTLYLIGGSTFYEDSENVSSLDSILRYNEAEMMWEVFTHMATPRHDTGCTVLGTKIYILGGMNSTKNETLDDVLCLDVETGTWEGDLRNLNSRALGIACCSLPLNAN